MPRSARATPALAATTAPGASTATWSPSASSAPPTPPGSSCSSSSGRAATRPTWCPPGRPTQSARRPSSSSTRRGSPGTPPPRTTTTTIETTPKHGRERRGARLEEGEEGNRGRKMNVESPAKLYLFFRHFYSCSSPRHLSGSFEEEIAVFVLRYIFFPVHPEAYVAGPSSLRKIKAGR